MRYLSAIYALSLLAGVSSASADDSTAPATTATDKTQDAEINKLKNDLEKAKQTTATIATALKESTAEPAERVMRHGITVGAAYTLNYGIGGGTRLHGVQGGSVTAYVAVFPVYWFSRAGANAYCAAQWSASEEAARGAEVLASAQASEAARLLRVLRAELTDEKAALTTRAAEINARIKAAAGSSCTPTTDAPPVRNRGDVDAWNSWCNGKLRTQDLDGAVKQINDILKKKPEAKPEAKVDPKDPKADAAAALEKKVDKILETLDAPKTDIRPALKSISCPSVEDAAKALTSEGSVSRASIEDACRLFRGNTEPNEKARLDELDRAAADQLLVRILTEFNARAASSLESELAFDPAEKRIELRTLSTHMWDELANSTAHLELLDSREEEGLRRLIEAKSVDAWGDGRTPALSSTREVAVRRENLKLVYRREILRKATRDLDEQVDRLPVTEPYVCLPNKLGAYVGVGTPFEATVYAPSLPAGGLIERSVSPVLTFGGALAPNALFSLLVGVSVGSMERADDDTDSRTEPIWMGTLGLGGNLDIASVLQ